MKFIGNNVVALNEAMVMAAIQMYMESSLLGPADFKVTNVKQTDTREYCKTFEVSIQGVEVK